MVLQGVMDKRKKQKLFWKLQLVFWFSHGLFWILVQPSTLKDPKVLFWQVILYTAPIILSFVLRYINKKYQIYRLPFLSQSIVIIVLSACCGIIWVAEIEFIGYCLYGEIHLETIYDDLIRRIFYQSYPFFAWNVIYLGYKYYEESVLQKQQADKAMLLAKNAQLEMLKYQLNPHFLFNTLSSLRGLISTEPEKARTMVTRISEILRYSLLEGKNNEVPLFREIEIIQQYLFIEKVRFNEDLMVEFDIAPETNDVTIPVFLIHPLVENAIKHGMQTSILPLKILVTTAFSEGKLFILVRNSGRWIEREQQSDPEGTGTGLQNIQKRLEHSYPDNYSFGILKEPDSVEVRIQINSDRRYE